MLDLPIADYLEYSAAIRAPGSLGQAYETLLEQYLLFKRDKPDLDNIFCTILSFATLIQPPEPETIKKLKEKWLEYNTKGTEKKMISSQHHKLLSIYFQEDGNTEMLFKALLDIICFRNELHQRLAGEGSSKNEQNEFFSMFRKDPVDAAYIHVILNRPPWPHIEGEYCFTYEALWRRLNNEDNRTIKTSVVSCLIDSLKAAFSYSKLYPKESTRVAQSTMHVCDQILNFTAFPVVEELKKLMVAINYLTRLPNPTSFLAMELERKILLECKARGYTAIRKIREEIPAVDLQREEFDDPATVDIFRNYNTVYCYLDRSCEAAVTMMHNLRSTEEHIQFTPEETRLLIILYVFSLRNKLDLETIKAVLSLSTKIHFEIYAKIVQVLEQTMGIDNIDDVTPIQGYAVEEIIAEMKSKRVFSQREGAGEKYLDKEKILAYVTKANTSCLPPFPHFKLVSLRAKTPAELREELSEHIQSQLALELPLHQRPLKFIIFGGDVEIHQFVQEYGNLCTGSLKAPLMKNDIRVYIIPTQTNNLARILAEQDHWYARYIYSPFKSQTYVPRIADAVSDEVQWGQVVQPPPGGINIGKEGFAQYVWKESLLQSYLREANRKFKIKLGVAECYRDGASALAGSRPDATIYFYQGIELGLRAQLNTYRLEKNLRADFSVWQLAESMKKNRPIEMHQIKIKCNRCPLDGNVTGKGESGFEEETIRTVASLSIANFNVDHGDCREAFPNSDWYEMTYIDQDSFKCIMAGLKSKEGFKENDPHTLRAVFDSMKTSVTTTKVTLTSASPKVSGFQLCIDGKNYGPFHTVQIKPHVVTHSIETARVSIPIMTFLPVTL